MSKTHSNLVRVLHVINGEHYSGGERVQDILGQTLPSYGYDVGFACLKPDLFPKVYRSKTCPIYSLPMKHRADFSPLQQLRKVIREQGYKLIHSHMPRTAPLSRLASFLENVPMVHHIHCPTLYDSPYPIKNLISATLERLSLICIARIIPCSEGMKLYARSVGISENRISVVLNGIPQLGPLEDRPDPTNEWVFGIAALFRPRKGLEYLLKAMENLKNKGYRFRFRAIGDFMSEEYHREIDQLVQQLGIMELIDWIGFKEDVPRELKKLDFFVLPSTGGEGLPIAILEGMAAGLPIITTEIAGSKEVIRDGLDGYLCQPESVESLTVCFEKMMSSTDNWKVLRKNAYRRQKDHFSDHSMTAGVARVYQSILNKNK